MISLTGLALLAAPTHASEPPLLPLTGCWAPTTEAGPHVELREDGRFAFADEGGRYLVQGPEIWLLRDGEPRMGTKWRLTLDDQHLVLSHPEDFQYLGGSDYLYLQLTPPETTWTLAPAACREAVKE